MSSVAKKETGISSGMAFGLGAALIWGGFPVLTRLSLLGTGIDFLDITFLRFAVSGVILLPFLFRMDLSGVSWRAVAILVAGIGAPYMLIVSLGLKYAPADQFAAVTPGSMICFSLIIGSLWLHVPAKRIALAGVSLIVLGIVLVALHSFLVGTHSFYSYALFLAGGFLWALYTVAVKKYGIHAFYATVIVCVFSMIIYTPVYFYARGLHLLSVNISAILIYGIYQGIFVSFVALFFYSKAVGLLGTTAGSTFAALVPAFAAIMARFLLHESPSVMTIAGLSTITVGMVTTILGPQIYLRVSHA